MPIAALINLIAVLGIIIAIGIVLTRFIRFEGEVKKALVTVIVNVAVPCIILHSLFQLPINDALFRQMGLMLAASLAVHGLGVWFALGFGRATGQAPRTAREIAVLAGIGNTGFIGIPLCSLLFGPKGALLAAVFDAGVDVVMWTLGVFLLRGQSRPSASSLKSLINIPIAAIVLGLLLASLQFDPPAVFKELTRMLSSLTTPLAMLYIGMMVASLYRSAIGPRLRETVLRYSRILWNPLLLKLLIIPLGVAALLASVRPAAEIAPIILLLSATPTFTMSSILFAHCGANEELAVVTTVASTLLSLLTIPLVAWVGLQYLG